MEVGQGTAQELVAEEESNCRNTPLSRSCIASVCLKQWKVICLPIPAAEMSWGTLLSRTYGDRVGKMAPLFLIVPKSKTNGY